MDNSFKEKYQNLMNNVPSRSYGNRHTKEDYEKIPVNGFISKFCISDEGEKNLIERIKIEGKNKVIKDLILSHYVTIFLNSSNEELDGMMFNEETNTIITHHDKAIKNIEKQMNKLRIPYISAEHYDLMDILYDHTCYGNIIITSFKLDEVMLFIYLPEFLNEKQKKIITYLLNEFDEYEIHLFKQQGQFFYTEHKENYVKNKQISLTKSLQKTENNKKD